MGQTRRERLVGARQLIGQAFGFAKVLASSLGASKSTEVELESVPGESSPTNEELWGHGPLLYRPADPSADGSHCEALWHDLGGERVVLATKDRRWQIEVDAGEVIVRAMGAGSPAYIHLKPDGSASLHATSVNLGGDATQFVALANLVTSQLTALKGFIATAGGAAVAGDGGAAAFANLTAALLTAWPTNVAATKIKAK